MDERERIALLSSIFASSQIGDDAAIIGDMVVSVDAVVEDVHFKRAWLSLHDLGYRATMAALSDIAAMGAQPCGVLSSLSLPAELSDDELRRLAEGQDEAARACGSQVIGGNLTVGDALCIHTTVLGRAEKPLLRRGAQPGDLLLAAGDLGLAARGLRALQEGRDDPDAIAAWRRPTARIREGLAAAAAGAHAAIDVSDGLSLDASRFGLKVIFDDALAEQLAAGPGGEDYALLVAAPAAIDGFRQIGRLEAGTGVFCADRRIEVLGWDHFASG